MMVSHGYNQEGNLMQGQEILNNTIALYILSMVSILNTMLMDIKFQIVSIILL